VPARFQEWPGHGLEGGFVGRLGLAHDQQVGIRNFGHLPHDPIEAFVAAPSQRASGKDPLGV
jgi:hypothetical protein